MIKSTRLRTTLSASTILAAGLLLVVTPAQAQNLPDTGNVSVSTRGLSGGAPGSTDPGFSTSGAAGAQTLRVDLKDNRTILNWGGTGFNVAAGNTVDFKDARATAGVTGRTDNIAVLNRDLSGNTSNILGTIKSDPNVAVYVLNQSGILFGDNASVNTGAFFAGTSNLSNDNDFLNAATTLRFSGSTGGTITANAGSQFTTAASASSNGGRMGDLVMMGSAVLFRGSAGNATSGGAAGDVALIAASDAAITNAPGSPLSIQIYSGTSLFDGIEVGGASTVRGKNVILAYGMNGFLSGPDTSVSIYGNLVATGAQVTDQGVVLAAGSPAGPVTMDLNAISGIGSINQTGTINSAKNVLSSDINHNVDGAITAAGDVNFLGFVSSNSANGTITGANVNFSNLTVTHGLVTATAGNVTYSGGLGLLNLGGGVKATGDVVFDGLGFTLGGSGATIGGALKVTVMDTVTLDAPVTAGSVDIKTTNAAATGFNSITGGNITTTTGDLSLVSVGDVELGDLSSAGALTVSAAGHAWLGTISSAGNAGITATNDILFSAGATAGGNLSISADSLALGSATSPGSVFKAAGSVDLTATSGSVTGSDNVSVQSNSDGVGSEALTITAATGVDFAAGTSLMGGTARQSDVIIKSAGASALGLGDVSARTIRGSIDGGTVYDALYRDAPIALRGAINTTSPFFAEGTSLTVNGPITVSAGYVELHSASPLTISSAIKATGDVTVTTSSGDLTVAAGGSFSGHTIVLSTPERFVNNGGANIMSASDRWVVYSAAPDTDTFGGLDSGNTAVWSSTFANSPPLVLGSFPGNRYVFAYRPTLTFTSLDYSKVYGTQLIGNEPTYTVTGFEPGVAHAFLGDTAGTTYSSGPSLFSGGFAERASVAGGPYQIFIGPGTIYLFSGYASTFNSTGRLTVTPKPLGFNLSAFSKTYDGTTHAAGDLTIFGMVAGDTVGTSGTTFTFADKNAGAGKTVSVTGTVLTGTDAGNYTLTLPASVMADIFQKAITGDIVANNKTYDGTTVGSGTVTLNGVVSGDAVGTGGTTFTFSDKNAGTGKVVTVAGTVLTGADRGNYTLTVPTYAFADILRKVLTTSVVANNKTYDGTTAGSGTVTLNGVVAGDAVGTSGTIFTFSDKNAGTGKTVTIAGTSLTGADAGNYSFVIPSSALADILKKAVTAGVVVNNKTYDGTTTGSGTVTLNGIVAGDAVTTSGTTFTFADKNAGSGKTVTVAGTTIGGADAGNYSITIPASAFADILKKALTATVAANNKTYDGTTAGTGTVSLNGVVAGDTVGTGGTTFTFADKNAGTGKAVNVAGTTLTGADASNYTLTIPASALADILKKAITANVTANAKTYDGTTAGTGTVTLNGVVAGDAVGTNGTTFTFSDKNAGTGKTVTVAGTTLTGADAGNYTFTIPASALADILKKAITAGVAVDNKTYDGTTTGTGTVTLNGLIAGDAVTTSGTTFTFADKNAGTGKTVTVAGTTIGGADAGNYAITIPASAFADILKKALTANVAANNKTYDGTTAGSGSVTLNGVVAGDAVGTSGTTFTFSDKNAGTGKNVAVAGTALTGADAGNYTLTIPASALADILKKAITADVVANGKTYDGTTAGTGTVTLNGVVSGDAVGTSGTTFTFSDKNAGTGKNVAVAGTALTGADAGNYMLTVPASALADILKKAIIADVVANGKTYDGTTAGSGTVTLNGVVSGDAVGTSGTTFTFADKTAGTGKAVTIAGTTLTGADAGNYTVTIPASALADILKKAISANVAVTSKTYDGTTAGTGTVTLNGVVAGDAVTTSGTTFTFADKNAGTGKNVAVAGTTIGGADAGNYTITIPPSALGDILTRAIAVKADDASKTQNDADPALTFTITSGSLVTGDSFSGGVARDSGENPGTYAIRQGTLSAGDNYTLDFAPGTFTINLPLGSEGLQPAFRAQPLPSQISTGAASGSSVDLETSAVCGDDKNCTTGKTGK
ncbi:MAG: YDG domain-containing protein [Sphingomonas sp.]|uniref:YDG domain-containing protein n=1 Tax=Sphingomonas sp. TaxID=28214 RepID=UPI003F819D42